MLPKERAGRTVLEIMGTPDKQQMKAHVTRILSGDILKRAFASAKGVEQLRENVEVSAQGPFITITAYASDMKEAGLAAAVANSYDEDLRGQDEGVHRRANQAIEAFINIKGGETETARLNWMEIMKKYQLTADGRSLADETAASEMTSRLAKAKADLVPVTQRVAALKERDTDKVAAAILASPSADAALKGKCQEYFDLKATASVGGAPPEAAANLKTTRERLNSRIDSYRTQSEMEVQALRTQISSYDAAVQELDKAAFSRLNRRSEMDQAKMTYDSQKAMLNRLKDEAMERRVKESVVQMRSRVIEEAAAVEVPSRFARRVTRFTVIGCAVLLAALLVSSFAGRCCRRTA
jgi:hypothetical protein